MGLNLSIGSVPIARLYSAIVERLTHCFLMLVSMPARCLQCPRTLWSQRFWWRNTKLQLSGDPYLKATELCGLEGCLLWMRWLWPFSRVWESDRLLFVWRVGLFLHMKKKLVSSPVKYKLKRGRRLPFITLLSPETITHTMAQQRPHTW